MKTITDISQFNTTNAKITTSGDFIQIQFPRIEYKGLMHDVEFISHTDIIALKLITEEAFLIKAVDTFMSKPYANSMDVKVSELKHRALWDHEWKLILNS